MPHSDETFFLFGLLLLGLCVSTPILQAACALYNKLAAISLGRESRQIGQDADRMGGVIKLDALRAFSILLATAMFNVLLSFLLSKVLRSVGVKAASGPLGIMYVARLISLPVSFLVLGSMLPTNFGRGLLIAVLYLLLWLIVGCVLLMMYFVIALIYTGLSAKTGAFLPL